MNAALMLSFFVAALATATAYYVARILVDAGRIYRREFQIAANRNLSDMFLFIDPARLFMANLLLLLLVFCLVLLLGGGPFLALLSATALGASPPLVYWYLRRRRLNKAVAQLPDALLSIATSLRSGLSLTQAMETMIAYQQPPLSQELGLTLRELRLGIAYGEAMDNLYRRLPEVEVQLVTAAMKVSREIGGNLAETLERISDTLRKRLQMEGKIRSLTAQGKLQGLVMTSLPVFLIFALSEMEPRAMSYLFDAWYGWTTIAVIVTLEVIGYHFIYKIVNIDV